MAATDTYPLIDRLIPGGLEAYLATARAAQQSYETIAFALRRDHDVTVGAETVRRWCDRTGATR